MGMVGAVTPSAAQPNTRSETMTRQRLTVEDLMTTAMISLKEKDTVGMANMEMHVASIRHIPVVDDANHLVGILSNRDLIRALAAGNAQTPIGEIMTRSVRTVRVSTPAHDAAQAMLDGKFGALPVVGDQEQLVGIVTETDFLEIAVRALRDTKLRTALMAS
jgi:CBS domain-containing protein